MTTSFFLVRLTDPAIIDTSMYGKRCNSPACKEHGPASHFIMDEDKNEVFLCVTCFCALTEAVPLDAKFIDITAEVAGNLPEPTTH